MHRRVKIHICACPRLRNTGFDGYSNHLCVIACSGSACQSLLFAGVQSPFRQELRKGTLTTTNWLLLTDVTWIILAKVFSGAFVVAAQEIIAGL